MEHDGGIEVDEEISEEYGVFVNAMSSSINHSTIKIKGVIRKLPFTILIDSDGTHSLVDEKVLKKLKLKNFSIVPLNVNIVMTILYSARTSALTLLGTCRG